MRKEHALRHLLLRHLKMLEGAVPPEIFREVTDSLQVSKQPDGFLVEWRKNARAEGRRIPAGDFEFYVRGDTAPASRGVTDDLTTNNAAAARTLAGRVFGVDPAAGPRLQAASAPWIQPWMVGDLAGIGVLVVARLLAAWPALVLAAISYAESFKAGRIYAACLFVPLAVLAPGAAMIGGAAYAALQFLDPNPRHRTARTLVCLASSTLGVAVKLATGDAFHAGIGSVAVVCAAVVVAALRSLVYSHARAVPLTMPFVWSGFQFDGHLTLAVAGLTLTVIEAVWAGVSSKIRTVQRTRAHARSIREAN